MTVAPEQLYTFRSSYATLTYSKDDLRALITQIESSFTQSDIYLCALNRLQERLGSQTNGLQLLVNALGREAIRLTIKEFLSSITTPPAEDRSSCLDTAAATFTIPPVPSSSRQPRHQTGVSIPISNYPVLADEIGLQPTAIPPSEPPILDDAGPSIPAIEAPEKHPPAAIAPPAITTSNPQFTKDDASQSPASPIKLHPQPSTNREKELSSIGQQLYQARTQHGLSIEQLHQKTCVPSHHIRALEDGIWHHLPEDIYLKGFIRLLGNAVGLSGSDLSQHLSVQTTESAPAPMMVSRVTQRPSPPHRSAQLKPAHLYWGYAALMASATGGLAWMVSQPATLSGSAVQPPESSIPPNLVKQPHPEKASFQILVHTLFQQMNAIAPPETIPPDPTFRPINP